MVVGDNEDGTFATMAIEALRPGDHVLARDERNPQAEARLQPVEEVFTREIDCLRILTLRDDNGVQVYWSSDFRTHVRTLVFGRNMDFFRERLPGRASQRRRGASTWRGGASY
jgi:hypothetical protein